MKFCNQCGSQVKEESLFCPFCGSKNILSGTNDENELKVKEDNINENGTGSEISRYNQQSDAPEAQIKENNAPIILGLVGLVSNVFMALFGHIFCIWGIVASIRDKNKKGLVICIIGEIVSIANSVLGVYLNSK